MSFTTETVSATGAVGYYSNLYFDDSGSVTVLYFDRTRSKAMRTSSTPARGPPRQSPPAGQIHVARSGRTVAFTNLNEAVPELEVLFL